MKKIRNIIVSTDFSAFSRTAYRYAKELANTLQAALTIIHVRTDFIMVSDVMVLPLSIEDDKALTKDIEVLMTEEDIALRNTHVKEKVKIKIFTGDPADVLTHFSENNETDLIVMGTTGLSNIIDKLFGSTSHKVSNKAHCPVILVPRDAKWQSIKHIMFASNYDSMTPVLINEVTDFALGFSADIDFLNVKNLDPMFETKQKEIDWDKLIVNSTHLSFKKHTIYGNDTIDQLKKYSEAKEIDLMVFASRHRNFWQNLIHKSVTENMALSTTIPIMVIHFDDAEN